MNLYSEVLNKNWLPVCKSCELKKNPLHIKLLDEEIVLFRNGQNVSALRDRCPS
jgi:phenylpropionate dioxygenase-like ring-hydroxylating dioxygenase large terminal subunit